MANITYTRPRVYEYQRAILDSTARFTVCEASTKVGKTASHIFWIIEEALKLKANQSVWWIAPVFEQSKIAFNRLRNQITDRNFFKVNETNLTLTLPTGAIIQFKSAEKPDNLFGDDVYAAVFDEFTRAREEAWFALRSTLTATKGKCKFIGNVKGKGWGHNLAMKAKNGEPGWEYFKITAYDAVEAGLLDISEIEDAKRTLPEYVFKELYLAEAADNTANPFGQLNIKQCIYPLSINPIHCYGIDLAKSFDWTVIIGLDKAGNVCYFDRFQKDWKQTKDAILMLDRSKPMLIDSTGVGDAITEDLQRDIPNMTGFKFTTHSKQELILGLVSAVQQRKITYPQGTIVDEMDSFEYLYTPTGVRYSAPQGYHDDCVVSLALAYRCLAQNIEVGRYYIV